MLLTTRTSAIALGAGLHALVAGAAWAEPLPGIDWLLGRGKAAVSTTKIVPAALFNSGSKKATTKTEVLDGKNARPMLGHESADALLAAIARYENIVATGGWQKISGSGKIKLGAKGAGVAALKRRLYAEGYVNDAAITGEQGQIATEGTIAALKLFQAHHGLSPTGKLDNSTVNELNVSPARRLATLRANLPRVQTYIEDVGSRYITVNIPALQLEAVSNGRVFSRHNIIVGKPDRPSPVVATHVKNIAFNPYWNVPASIVEKDLIPRILKEGVRSLEDQNIRVFDGFNGPEIDPRDVDWEVTPADRFFFRQDPGPDNAMATMKINFPSPFGVYMHDTPLRSLFGTGERLQSSGCVRVDKVPILANWILAGQDGWNSGRIAAMADSQEQLDVEIVNPPQLRWVYLTAWATPGGHVNFRRDIYNLDGTGFVVGQPLPAGEYSETGERFILKAPPPKAQAAYPPLEDDFSFYKPRRKSASARRRKVDPFDPERLFNFNRKRPAPSLFGFGKKKPKPLPFAVKNAKPLKKKKPAIVVEDDDPPPVARKVIANLTGAPATATPRKKAAKKVALTTVEGDKVKKKAEPVKKSKKPEPAKKVKKAEPKKKKKIPPTLVIGERGPIFGQD